MAARQVPHPSRPTAVRILDGHRSPATWATGRRRRLLPLALVLVFTVFPGGLGAVAMAQDGSGATGTSRMDGIAWMNIRDTAGVPLADYIFVGDHGGLHDLDSITIWTLVVAAFVGYLIMVAAAIAIIGYALSFGWLDHLAAALRAVAAAFADQLATPAVMSTATALGAFFTAWLVTRGFLSRAIVQILAVLAVAVVGPLFLAEPLAGILGSDGVLASGRDVGIAITAGLGGSESRDPDLFVQTMQAELADNFARRPVQVWNFGHIVDERPACADAWSAGMMSGDAGQTQRALGACGDSEAAAADPRLGQLGTGLVLLLSAAALLLFAVVLSVRLMRAALDAVYQAFMAIFGFAAGGFVFGPSQTFLVRNLVNCGIAAARMCAYTVFIGVYLALLGSLFYQARDQVVAVTVIAAVVEIVAIIQLRRLSRSLTRGSVRVANRVALTIHGVPAGSGGRARGTGRGASGSGQGVMAGLAVLNVVNSSPLTARLAGMLKPLSPMAHGRTRNDRADFSTSEMRLEAQRWNAGARRNWELLARREADEWGGIDTEPGLARAVKYLHNHQVPASSLAAVLLDAGASHGRVHNHLRARQTRDDTELRNPYGSAPLPKAVASGYAVLNHAGSAAEAAFAAAAVGDADSLSRYARAPAPGARLDHTFIARARQHWDSGRELRANIGPGEVRRVGRDTWNSIAHELAAEHLEATRAYSAAPTAEHRARLAASLDRLSDLHNTLSDFRVAF